MLYIYIYIYIGANVFSYQLDCKCDPFGAVGHCHPISGVCECNDGFSGKTCNECSEGYYGFPSCTSNFILDPTNQIY